MAHSRSVRASTSSLAAFNPSISTKSSHVSVMERSSCRSILVLRWKVDSVCLEGEAGKLGGLNFSGEDEGVEGPLNDASRLMKSVFVFDSDLGAKLITFFQESIILLPVNAKLGHT